MIRITGKKRWRFRTLRSATKKLTIIILGSYPSLFLAEARGLRSEYFSLLAKGIAPQTEAKQ
ncbi:integrase arm-type DNA-binding domain-containing protein [Rosenbergiella nectarea subsp. apis]|nr:integrase arm-type DNA-binding domain-containing protein [Rosenbergiella nectarea subsp. apis]